MHDMPEIVIVDPTFGTMGYLVDCQDLNCGFNDVFPSREDAEDVKRQHQQWHEDGMPQ